MAQKKWQVSKVRYCEHVGQKVALEVQVVTPPINSLINRCM